VRACVRACVRVRGGTSVTSLDAHVSVPHFIQPPAHDAVSLPRLCSTGAPVCGIVGQPFSEFSSGIWHSRMYWGWVEPSPPLSSESGGSVGRRQGHGVYPAPNEADVELAADMCVVVRSKSESPSVVDAIEARVGATVVAAGAGYKLLSLIRGQTSAYVAPRHYLETATLLHTVLSECDLFYRTLRGWIDPTTIVKQRRDCKYCSLGRPLPSLSRLCECNTCCQQVRLHACTQCSHSPVCLQTHTRRQVLPRSANDVRVGHVRPSRCHCCSRW
jgi:hypothetical protein